MTSPTVTNHRPATAFESLLIELITASTEPDYNTVRQFTAAHNVTFAILPHLRYSLQESQEATFYWLYGVLTGTTWNHAMLNDPTFFEAYSITNLARFFDTALQKSGNPAFVAAPYKI